MNEDDIEYDNDDDDTFHSTITTALTATCIVIQDHLDKAKHRLRKKKGRGRPFTIPRERMSILLIRRLLSDPYFKRSYRFSPQEIENLNHPIFDLLWFEQPTMFVDTAHSDQENSQNYHHRDQ